MRTVLLVLASTGLLAQAPRLDEAFFQGDRKVVLRELADRLRAERPKDAEALAECGRAYLGAMETAKAKDALKAAEMREPEEGPILRLVALAWLRSGYKAEALQSYELVLLRAPKDTDALAACATDLAETGLLAEAERYMKAVEAREPEGWEYFLHFGRACLVGGQRKAAAAWFARAVTLKPKEEKVLLEILRSFSETQSVL